MIRPGLLHPVSNAGAEAPRWRCWHGQNVQPEAAVPAHWLRQVAVEGGQGVNERLGHLLQARASSPSAGTNDAVARHKSDVDQQR